ncbi:hemolysin family protein [Thermospira aquatica]|uniref:HlyC/CorC family transporter n=1 Tax=Thermospira aquatica TaxID=2828656 RepID=A0AAX3BC61_9SPIR|nr:hemolysin family protein [Thermospira aquatica]URA09845.1 HlyC/CorC family transporter [Thermospira aquatica]
MGTQGFYLVFSVMLFILSAMFSSSETVFIGLDETQIRTSKYSRIRKQLRHITKRGGAVLVIVLLFNNMVNILLSSILSQQFSIQNPFLSSLVITGLILFISEMFPKTLSLFKPDALIRFNIIWFYPLFRVFEPLGQLTYKGIERFINFLRKIHKNTPDTAHDVKIETLLSIVSRENIFSKEEKDMIESVLNFAKREVWNIMTPRIRVVSVSADTPIPEILKICEKSHYSKIPVYEDTEDNLIGVVYIQDLLEYVHREKKQSKTARDIMKPLYYVPETKKLSDMLEDFKHKKLRLAAVVDEYGLAVGIVTIADVLGDIAGEVMDETFGLHKKIIKLSSTRFQVSGDVSLMDFNDYFDAHLQSDTYETIAGYLIEKYGDIPEKGTIIQTEHFIFTIQKSTDKQIEAILVDIKKRKRP